MHGPSVVFSVLADVHDNLPETATNATFLDRSGEAVEAVPIGELRQKRGLSSSHSLYTASKYHKGISTIDSRKHVVPDFSISAILNRAAA